MYNPDDILSGIPTNDDTTELLTKQELSSMEEALQEERQRLRKKLKRAKKRGKSGKKLKKKIKKLKKERKKLKKLLRVARQQPPKGRWDALIEKSVLEVFKLANITIDRRLPSAKGR